MYIDRKQTKSVLLQGICTANKILTNVYLGSSGRSHDARALSRSQIGMSVARFGPCSVSYKPEYHLIGDSAYPLRSWLVVPYKKRGTISEAEKNFNMALSKTRYLHYLPICIYIHI